MASTQKKTTKKKKAPPKPEPPAYNGLARLVGGVVCLLLAGLCWLAFHNRVRLRVALPALLLTAGLAVFTGNALSRDVVRVELVGSRNAPAVVISRNESSVILFRGGDVTRSAVETTLERRNIRTVECLIDLRVDAYIPETYIADGKGIHFFNTLYQKAHCR